MKYLTGNVRGMLCLTCLTLTTGLLLESAAADTIYKTIDAQGNITFSNIPPPEGTKAQQIEIQPGPTPAEQQQSLEAEQNLETQSSEIPMENSPAEQQPPVVQPTTEYQQDSEDIGDDQEPVVVDGDYVGDPNRDERLRDGVDDAREVRPVPAEAPHPGGRFR